MSGSSHAPTVEDVLQADLNGKPISVMNVGTMLSNWGIMQSEEWLDFIHQPDRFRVADIKEDGLDCWRTHTFSKFLKMVASEYALLRSPDRDTSYVTNLVRVLIQDETFHAVLCELTPASMGLKSDVPAKTLHDLLATITLLLVLYSQFSKPVAILLHIFREIYETHVCYAISVPSMLNFFLPGRSFHGQSTDDRLHMLLDQLMGRQYACKLRISAREARCLKLATEELSGDHENENEDEDSLGDGNEDSDVRVSDLVPISFRDLAAHKSVLPRVWVRWNRPDGTSEVELMTPRKFFAFLCDECRVYRDSIQEGKKKGKKAAEAQIQTLPAEQIKQISDVVKKILRFSGEYKEKLEKDKLLPSILKSEGWLPLSEVQRYVENDLASKQMKLPVGLEDIVEVILLTHDTFGRFEVDVCPVEGPFMGRKCARSMYAHNTTEVCLYKHTICSSPQVSSVEAVPLYGWMHMKKSDWKGNMKRPSISLYDRMLFLVVFPSEAIGHCRRYREYTPLTEQYDESFHGTSPSMFCEVYLHALVCDARVKVYARRNATEPHERRWYVFPDYEGTPGSGVITIGGLSDKRRELPKIFFTGRVAYLSPVGDNVQQGATVCPVDVLAEAEYAATEGKRRGTEAEFALSDASELLLGPSGSKRSDWTISVTDKPSDIIPLSWSWISTLRRTRSGEGGGEMSSKFPFACMIDDLAQTFASYLADADLGSDEGCHNTSAGDAVDAEDDAMMQVSSRFTKSCAAKELDLAPFKEQIDTFLNNKNDCIMSLLVPIRAADGGNFTNRLRSIGELKAYVTQRDLQYRKVKARSSGGAGVEEYDEDDTTENSDEAPSSPTATYDEYEVRKPFLWGADDVQVVITELGLENERNVRRDLILNALTRESENKASNYEMLEFAGDALMDFLAPLDAFLVMRTVPQSRVCTVPSLGIAGGGGDLPLGQIRMNLTESINQKLCNNKVLARLIPSSVEKHFDALYGNVLDYKVKADVFEALLGAVSKLGLDKTRRVMARLFSRLPEALASARADGEEEDAQKLADAIESCPYLFDPGLGILEELPLRAMKVIDEKLREKYLGPVGDDKTLAMASHFASQPFPRIQDKHFATHFTTGNAYSYRRILCNDAARIANRILATFAAGSIAYSNESITDVTHFVVDFDGADVRKWAVLRLFWHWYQQRFQCPAGLVLLDCTGLSPSKQNCLKNSCHVHFPQIALTLDDLDTIQNEFRTYLIDTLEKEKNLFLSRQSGLQWKRIVMSASHVKTKLSYQGWKPARHHWTYCSFDLLKTIAAVSRGALRSVFEHVGELIAQQDVALFSRVFGLTDAGHCLCTQLDVVVVIEDGQGDRWMVPEEWVSGSRASAGGITIVPEYTAKPGEPAKWDDILDKNIVSSKKLRMYLCDKYDMTYGQEHRPLHMDAMILCDKALDVSQAKEMRTSRPDRALRAGDCLRRFEQRQEHREELRYFYNYNNALVANPRSPRAQESDDEIRPFEHEEAGAEEYPTTVAHATTLKLTTLRCPTYRDVGGLLYDSWQTIGTDAASADPQGRRDVLPSFGEVVAQRWDGQEKTPRVQSWDNWAQLLKVRDERIEDKGNPAVKPCAISPSWWAYDVESRIATFYIASAAVYRIGNCASLIEALQCRPDGCGGMHTIAHFFSPHVQISPTERAEVKWTQSYVPHVMPLFVQLLTKKAQLSKAASSAVPKAPNNENNCKNVGGTAVAAAPGGEKGNSISNGNSVSSSKIFTPATIREVPQSNKVFHSASSGSSIDVESNNKDVHGAARDRKLQVTHVDSLGQSDKFSWWMHILGNIMKLTACHGQPLLLFQDDLHRHGARTWCAANMPASFCPPMWTLSSLPQRLNSPLLSATQLDADGRCVYSFPIVCLIHDDESLCAALVKSVMPELKLCAADGTIIVSSKTLENVLLAS